VCVGEARARIPVLLQNGSLAHHGCDGEGCS
jgi:hypothetical protein